MSQNNISTEWQTLTPKSRSENAFKFEYPVETNGHPCVMKGHWTAVLFAPDGSVKQTAKSYNLVTTVGKDGFAQFLNSAAAAATTFTFKYIGVGTDSTPAAIANTILGAEIARQTGVVSYIATQIYQIVATLAAGVGTGAITEYGLFSSSSAGTMMSRDVQSVINKAAGDTLQVTAQITFS